MKPVSRRDALKVLAVAGAAAGAGCSKPAPTEKGAKEQEHSPLLVEPVLEVKPLGEPPWETSDPFLFCVHHDDRYPRGNGQMGPAASLEGRNMGSDFAGKDGWRMYHGREVPGFPQHPHRGFETVTVVRRGLLDHSDSMGAAARYGQGDVQWLTAGSGIQHAEMFPLLREDRDNPVELFQIWLNLPAKRKMATPRFSMLWGETIPWRVEKDAEGRETRVTVLAGRFGSAVAPPPPPDSWASDPANQVGIWTIRMQGGARFVLPRAPGANRALYFFSGPEIRVGGRTLAGGQRIVLRSEADVELVAPGDAVELLLLQGRPIAEPISRQGPFVMNAPEEIRQAYADYRQTQFGGWPWPRHDPVHGAAEERFARHVDGRVEKPG